MFSYLKKNVLEFQQMLPQFSAAFGLNVKYSI